MPTYRRTFPGLAESVSRARHWTRVILSGSPHEDDAVLIVTELATNALLHSASGNPGNTFTFTLTRDAEGATLSVTDAGGTPSTPHVEHPDEDNPHGRGLALVATLAGRLHVHGDDKRGHTVTAILRAQAAAAVAATPGYWCECLVNGRRFGAFDATSPEQALRWVRISLMAIATSLDEEPYQHAKRWTEDGQAQALHALHQGEPCHFTLKHRTTAITWSAHPVTFLSLAHRQGAPLPPCSQQHSARGLHQPR